MKRRKPPARTILFGSSSPGATAPVSPISSTGPAAASAAAAAFAAAVAAIPALMLPHILSLPPTPSQTLSLPRIGGAERGEGGAFTFRLLTARVVPGVSTRGLSSCSRADRLRRRLGAFERWLLAGQRASLAMSAVVILAASLTWRGDPAA